MLCLIIWLKIEPPLVAISLDMRAILVKDTLGIVSERHEKKSTNDTTREQALGYRHQGKITLNHCFIDFWTIFMTHILGGLLIKD